MPIADTPDTLRRSISSACIARFQGQRPSASSVGSSTATTTEVGGCGAARESGSSMS